MESEMRVMRSSKYRMWHEKYETTLNYRWNKEQSFQLNKRNGCLIYIGTECNVRPSFNLLYFWTFISWAESWDKCEFRVRVPGCPSLSDSRILWFLCGLYREITPIVSKYLLMRLPLHNADNANTRNTGDPGPGQYQVITLHNLRSGNTGDSGPGGNTILNDRCDH